MRSCLLLLLALRLTYADTDPFLVASLHDRVRRRGRFPQNSPRLRRPYLGAHPFSRCVSLARQRNPEPLSSPSLGLLQYPTLTKEGFTTEVHHVDGKGENAGVVYAEMQARENGSSDLMALKCVVSNQYLFFPRTV